MKNVKLENLTSKLNDFRKFEIQNSKLKSLKGGNDIIIEDLVDNIIIDDIVEN